MILDLTLRRAYQRVIWTDNLGPESHSEGGPIPCCTSNGFRLKVSQGGEGSRSYMERINILNCMNKSLPQMANCKPADAPTAKGLWTSPKE